MDLTEHRRAFLNQHHRAAMVTLRRDGSPHAVRVAAAFVDGRVWSSGLPGRVRTRHVRRDPRCMFFVFDRRLRLPHAGRPRHGSGRA